MRTVKHFTVECKICRRIGIQYAKPVYSSVHEPVLPYRTVHRRLIFSALKSILVKFMKIFTASRMQCIVR